MPSSTASRGFTFVQLLVALVLIGILAGMAVPSFRALVDRARARSALDHVVAELYRARMLAVESGGETSIVLHSDGGGCVQRFRLLATRGAERSGTFEFDLPGLCLRHSGDSILVFNSRGMLRPPTRSFRVSYGTFADSVLLSIAGRVRRSYRRSCR